MGPKRINIQDHRVLARRYRSMAAAYLRKINKTNSENNGVDETYSQLIEMAIEHERKVNLFRKSKKYTFIFIKR